MCGLPCVTVTASLSLKIFVVMLASVQYKIFKVFILNLRCNFLKLFNGNFAHRLLMMSETKLEALYIKAFSTYIIFSTIIETKIFIKLSSNSIKQKLPRRMTIPCEVFCNYNDIYLLFITDIKCRTHFFHLFTIDSVFCCEWLPIVSYNTQNFFSDAFSIIDFYIKILCCFNSQLD